MFLMYRWPLVVLMYIRNIVRCRGALGHRGGAECERTAAWRMGEPRRPFMGGLYRVGG
jgi:hypothetical protein